MCGMLFSSTKITHLLSADDLAPDACEENREKWLRAYCDDPIFLVATATTEPDSGSANSISYFNDLNVGYRTLAVRNGDEYVINGIKQFVSHINHARPMFVFVRTDPTDLPPQNSSKLNKRIFIDCDRNATHPDKISATLANLG